MSDPRTVLFHPLNHIGLGHINRLSVIALALREVDKNIRTPFVVEEAAHVLLDALGLPYVPLPSSHAMNDTAAWEAWSDSERFAVPDLSIGFKNPCPTDPRLRLPAEPRLR